MNNLTIIFEQNNITTTLIVRNKNGQGDYNDNLSQPINNTLNILGLEQVPFSELVPRYKQIKSGDNLIGQQCSICQEEYKIKEFKRELECKHMFHKKCVDKWLKTHLTCPFCRCSINVNLKI